jgi:ACS family tartrate transporter-like MFS transporter
MSRDLGFNDSVFGLAMLINGWHSDRHLERQWHAVIPVLTAIVGALGLITIPPSLPTTLLLFSLLAVQMAFLAPFWALPTETLSEAAAAAAVGLISCMANIAGFFGPLLFGYLRTRTGSLSCGYAMLMASGIASCILLLMIPGTHRPATQQFSSSTLPADV